MPVDSVICSRKLFEARGLVSVCRCPRCSNSPKHGAETDGGPGNDEKGNFDRRGKKRVSETGNLEIEEMGWWRSY
jgi:hypothetical protein